MQRFQQLLTQCRALYDQWLLGGGFSANGLFMEGHYCLRDSTSSSQPNNQSPTL
ncbi:hypothetical protein [Rosenbergiella australiborealis]|uniref:Uncharacterized protein n=1 Tax=Rosenbergiella australiborealis TaxID=1544696 RepID=A0ABS5T346_9GAMM|nr:hypothetical protein [Rosenbergiella australiborealis]MBT0726774.1 hypothetical protein [Rosenbergiella australiborealis]